ncbi:hypothetical protein [Bradyrhizobium guangdongense]|uniref:Uncharacterized protein n=1 Tax=Bradyrhizobium guangdongense TaxID=1325090 RepID=A0A410UYD1_9BRAD|nr:hypothetical protein [Bradyrhizobium guangdongense]QAU36413.1 hypothetical protein X265_00935 [Bradyrhizobium guangdongense]QOZ57460.1 hypothetical protein XH86_00935 [Bradyrhizobium guangdongense]GGI30190.1 hypothetical protein GCM10010987_58210 [Bradyrhizobium guangdongense]
MDFGNLATIWALRATVKLAWGIARTARALGGLGERLEAAVDAQAYRSGVDIADVLEPLIAAARG